MILKGCAFAFNADKDVWLHRNRGVGFDGIVSAIERGVVRAVKKHPNAEKYPHQMMLEIVIDGYGYAIPFVIQNDGTVFMKTICPSRKVTKTFDKSAKK